MVQPTTAVDRNGGESADNNDRVTLDDIIADSGEVPHRVWKKMKLEGDLDLIQEFLQGGNNQIGTATTFIVEPLHEGHRDVEGTMEEMEEVLPSITPIPEEDYDKILREAGKYLKAEDSIAETYQGDIEIRNGGYSIRREQNGEVEYYGITNFLMTVNSVMEEKESGDTKIELTVIPSSMTEDSYEVVVEPTVFNDNRTFREEIACGRTTTFNGTIEQLNELRMAILQQDAPRRIGVDTVGNHGDEMVTPNGVLDEQGKVSDATHQYISEGSQAIDTKFDLEIDSGVSDIDEDEVIEILRTLPKIRDSDRFLPLLGWWYSSLFGPRIRDWEGELPSVMVSADTGAGKTATFQLLYNLIGMDGRPYSARDTKFALLSAMSSSNNIPIWLDEYKPSDMQKYEVDRMQDLLRKTTRGGDATRGNADQTVTRYTLEAPIALSGEQEIQGSAEERRTIRTQFRKSATEEGSDTAEAFAKLTGGSYKDENGVQYTSGRELEEHAKAVWQWVMEQEEGNLRNSWDAAKNQVYDILSEANIAGISDLEITALTTIRWGCTLYDEFGTSMGTGELLPDEEVEQAILYIAGTMGEENRTSHVDEFMSLVKDAALAGYIRRDDDYRNKPGDFKVINEGQDDEEIRLKLSRVHAGVSRYIKEHNLDGVDLLNSPSDYKSRMRDLAEDGTSYVNDTSVPTANLNRCVAISTKIAQDEVEGFDRTFIEQYNE